MINTGGPVIQKDAKILVLIEALKKDRIFYYLFYLFYILDILDIWEYSLKSFQWIMNPLYKFDTEFEKESPNYPSASIPLKTVTYDIPDADQILLISQIYRQAG